MDLYLNEIIRRSNLTKLQVQSLYNFLLNNDLLFDDEIKLLKSKPSGEISTIRRQARKNIKESIYTFILGFYIGFLKKDYIPNLLEMSELLKKLSEQNVFSETMMENLDKIIDAMLV
jgi:hypothetical protein